MMCAHKLHSILVPDTCSKLLVQKSKHVRETHVFQMFSDWFHLQKLSKLQLNKKNSLFWPLEKYNTQVLNEMTV